ncbi:MAG TPA: vWA domain-containing protein [Acidobacteriaceae bacterium]|nr:vWA domain-containing protein [Acidobacteriaceae bacterium]
MTTVQATYQIVPYSGEYRAADTADTLDHASNLVAAVGGKSGCSSMRPVGGQGTYYASAIYAAQASLVAEQSSRPGSQNVMILITDGWANSMPSQMPSSLPSSGIYPSSVDECGQAIIAARAAARAGTRVYAVAYGALPDGCVTDVSGPYKGYTPCQTMKAIASSPKYFFSDYAIGFPDSRCVSASHRTTKMNQIFKMIAKSIESDKGVRKPPPQT